MDIIDSIKNDLVEIAENEQKVFNAGQLSVITESEALKGVASGSVVALRDVSPVEHNVKCGVESKNLFNKNNANIIVGMFANSGDGVSPAGTTRSVYISCKPNTTYTISKMATARFFGGFTSEVPNDNVIVNNVVNGGSGTNITITSASDSKYLIIYLYHSSHDTAITLEQILESLQIEKGTTATAFTPYIENISTVKVQRFGKNIFNGELRIWEGANRIASKGCIKVKPNTFYTIHTFDYTISKPTFEVRGNHTGKYSMRDKQISGMVNTFNSGEYEYIWFREWREMTQDGVTLESRVQMEEGKTATEYEPYIEPTEYPTNADGTVEGIKSLYPSMTLIPDTEGVIISAEYIKDIDKAFSELQQALISLGSIS